MADTFNNDLRVREQEAGSNSGTWGGLLNTTISNLASAFGQGSEAIPNASTHTITLADGTADEARSMYLKCTNGGQACTVTLAPNTISKVWIISNETSHTLTFSQGSGANVAVAAGAVKMIVTDGAGSGAAVTDALSGLSANVSDVTTTGNIDVTGSVTADGLTVDGVSKLKAGSASTPADTAAFISNASAKLVANHGNEYGAYVGYANSSNDAIGIQSTTSGGTTAPLSLNPYGGNVGVGTASPSAGAVGGKVVHVQNSGATASVRVDRSDASTSGTLSMTSGNTTNGIFSTGSKALVISTNSTERMRIDASGRVGIGESSPATDLHITNSGATQLLLESGTSSQGILLFGDADDLNVGSVMYDHSDNSMRFETSDTERMRIDSSGNLLVGKTSAGSSVVGQELRANGYNVFTRDGDTPLELYRKTSDGSLLNFTKDGTTVGSIGTSGGDLTIGTGDTGIRFDDGTDQIYPVNGTSTRDGAIDLGWSGGRFKDLYLSSAVKFGSQDALATDGTSTYVKANSNIYFQPANSQRMLLDTSGNLLVGKTSSFAYSTGVEARQNGLLAASRDSAEPLLLNRTTNDGTLALFAQDGSTVGSILTNGGRFAFIGTRNSVSAGFDFEADNRALRPVDGSGGPSDGTHDIGRPDVRWKDLNLTGGLITSGNKFLYSYAGSSHGAVRSGVYLDGSNAVLGFYTGQNEAARFESDRSFRLGTTSSGFSAKFIVRNTASYTIHSIRTGTGSEGHVVFANGNGAVGTIFTNGTSTSYNTSSDQRLKENIADAPSASDDIDAIQVRSFDWKADGSHQKYGMVAQELQSVAPEVVTGDAESDEMMGVDYSKLVPMLVKEIQSLRARVQQLENG